jgi:hypothetical protein
MDKIELLENLISEGDSLTPTIVYVPAPNGVFRTYSVYRTNQQEKYQNWLSSVQRYVKSYYSSDLDNLKEASKKLSPENHRKILGLLGAIKLLPEEPQKVTKDTATNITINNTQNNVQSVVFSLIIESVKDEITGKELKELKELLKEFESEPIKTKTKLIDKIKGFGTDVLSNMIANILTNPIIYSGLVS